MKHHIFKSQNRKIFCMDIMSNVDTTTFVLVTLMLFAFYNIALYCWFRFFSKDTSDVSVEKEMNDKFSESNEVKEITDELDDLPF